MSRVMDTESRPSEESPLRRGVDRDTSPTPAIQGRSTGRHGWTGSEEGETLASVLGWFSVGLGVAQVVAPEEVARLIGARRSRRVRRIMRAAGVREIGHGVAILSHPRPKEWVATRIAGDVLDLALLGGVLAVGSERRRRTLLATVAVAGVTALDILGFEMLSESRKAPGPEALEEPGSFVRKSITVARSAEEIYRFWRDFENLPRFMRHLESVHVTSDRHSLWKAIGPRDKTIEWTAELVEDVPNETIGWRSVEGSDLETSGRVLFRAAPADQGTEVTVEMRYAPPGGRLSSAVLRLLRKEPGQQVADDLRHLKQLLETGEVLLSDATAVPGVHAARPTGSDEWPRVPVRRSRVRDGDDTHDLF